MAKKCVVCNGKADWGGFKISEKRPICKNCLKEAGYGKMPTIVFIESLSVDDVKKDIENQKSFKVTREAEHLQVDEEHGTFRLVNKGSKNFDREFVYNFKDLKSYELTTDSTTVTKGGMTFGNTGGIFKLHTTAYNTGRDSKEKVESIEIFVRVNKEHDPKNRKWRTIKVWKNKAGLKKTDKLYKTFMDQAKDDLTLFDFIKDSINKENEEISVDPVNEVKKYKSLVDEGIITEEEFAAKKEQLLNI